MTWEELTGGAPKEPTDLDEACSFPGPSTFFDALFVELIGHPPGQARVESEEEAPGRQRTARGRQGNDAAGVRFTERTCLETSAIPMSCVWETYGLPGIELRWEFSLETINVAGPIGFRHGALRVRCADAAARRTLDGVWRRVFGTTPAFRPVS